MSLKSYFRKDHKYKTQSDLKDMTAEEIVCLNPSEVGFYIETETGGIPLTGVKKKALYNLLARKKLEKQSGINLMAREKMIDSFLKREGLRNDPEVTKLLVKTDNEITSNRVQMKSLENRLRKLRNETEIPYTDEEKIYLRMLKLPTGGKSIRHYGAKNIKSKSYKKTRKHKR
jgi:hypothetical protein